MKNDKKGSETLNPEQQLQSKCWKERGVRVEDHREIWQLAHTQQGTWFFPAQTFCPQRRLNGPDWEKNRQAQKRESRESRVKN